MCILTGVPLYQVGRPVMNDTALCPELLWGPAVSPAVLAANFQQEQDQQEQYTPAETITSKIVALSLDSLDLATATALTYKGYYCRRETVIRPQTPQGLASATDVTCKDSSIRRDSQLSSVAPGVGHFHCLEFQGCCLQDAYSR